MTRFLVVRPGAIGDAVLAAPALAALRAALPGTELTFVAHRAIGPLFLQEGLADCFVDREAPASDALFAPRPEAAHEKFGTLSGAVAWTADPEGTLRANLSALCARPPIVAPSRPPDGSGVHVAQHLLATLAPLGVGGFDPGFSLPSVAARHGSARPDPVRTTPRIVIHPGSGGLRKNWPTQRFVALTEALANGVNASVDVLVGPADEAAAATYAARPSAAWQLRSEQPLEQLAELLADCDLYVGNDSGISHLAGLCGAPTLVLFGPTDPVLWRSLGPRVSVLRAERLEDLDLATVRDAALALLDRGYPPVGPD